MTDLVPSAAVPAEEGSQYNTLGIGEIPYRQ